MLIRVLENDLEKGYFDPKSSKEFPQQLEQMHICSIFRTVDGTWVLVQKDLSSGHFLGSGSRLSDSETFDFFRSQNLPIPRELAHLMPGNDYSTVPDADAADEPGAGLSNVSKSSFNKKPNPAQKLHRKKSKAVSSKRKR